MLTYLQVNHNISRIRISTITTIINKLMPIIKMEVPMPITTSMANMMLTMLQVNGIKIKTGIILGNSKIIAQLELKTMDIRNKLTMKRRILWQS